MENVVFYLLPKVFKDLKAYLKIFIAHQLRNTDTQIEVIKHFV